MVKHHVISKRAVHTSMALIAILLLASIAHGGRLLFVDDDAPPGGDGISWDSAYRFLADALITAGKGQVSEIRVAQGVYKPDRDESNPDGTGDREATFQLIKDLALMGGYAGIGAKDPNARDIELYETILSGDLLGDDGPNFENNDENSYTVVTGSATDQTAVLDGLTITAGNANGPYTPDNLSWGAGMYNDRGDPTISRCIFVANIAANVIPQTAGAGGGMFNLFSNPMLIECQFIQNVAGPSGGGGMYNRDSSPLIIDCLFYQNEVFVNAGGAGMQNLRGHPVVIECSFIENSVDTFNNGHGGAMGNQDSRPFVINCLFENNSADGHGGAMVSNGTGADPIVVNCLFVRNEAAFLGGAMYSNHSSRPRIANCTFVANTAGTEGGGLGTGGTVYVRNSVFWNNIPDELAGGDGLSARYCDVQGGWPGTGNIDADPLFVAPGTGDYRLSPGSPCIDAGNNWGVPIDANDSDEDGLLCELFPVDLDGNPRFNADEADFDPGCGVPVVVDMGAYEYQFDPADQVTFADLNGDDAVGAADLLGLLVSWGPCAMGCCLADLDLDGNVGASDLLALLANWGPCP